MDELNLQTKWRNKLYDDCELNWGSISFEEVQEVFFDRDMVANIIE